MALKKGWKNVTLRPSVVTKLNENFRAEKNKYSESATLGTYANDILESVLDNKDYIRRYAPLKWEGAAGNLFVIKDNFKQTTIEIEIHGGKKMLWCREDKTDDCDHIGFCWAQNDVYTELKKHGFKPPKMKQ